MTTRMSMVARLAATVMLAVSLLACAAVSVAARDEPPGQAQGRPGTPATAEQIRELVRKQRERVLARIEAAFTGETATGQPTQLELIQTQRERVLAQIEDVFATNEAAAEPAVQAEPAETDAEAAEPEGGEPEGAEPEGAEAEDGEPEDGEAEGDEGVGGEDEGDDEGADEEDVSELPDTGVGPLGGASGLVPALMAMLAALAAIAAGRRWRFR